jgi:uncharacterized protein YjiK
MKPPANFGKGAFEYDQKNRRQNMQALFALVVLLVAGVIGFTWRKSTHPGEPSSYSPDKVTILKKWDMPQYLKEISGLTYVDEQRLACVQDEAGTIFIYNIEKNTVEKEIHFGEPGDYEGLTLAGKTAWVLRADGLLFEVKDIHAKQPAVKEYRTHLTVKENCEGLCYDKSKGRLLVAVKDQDPNSTSYKGIYEFDLSNYTMAKEPVIKINLEDEIFANAKGKKKKGITFKPTGITIHPVTQDLYITDGPGSRLLVTDKTGTIKKLLQLDRKIFTQPEGITFSERGELFISNEGVKGSGNILKVSIEPK